MVGLRNLRKTGLSRVDVPILSSHFNKSGKIALLSGLRPVALLLKGLRNPNAQAVET
jgi:hypothetical protein